MTRESLSLATDTTGFFLLWTECEPDARRIELPNDFYERLDRNKQVFEYSTSEEADSSGPSGGFSSEERVMRRLRAKEVKNCKRLTDRDDEFRREVLQAFITGVIPENTTRRIKNRLESEADPLRALQILRDEIPESVLKAQARVAALP